MFSIEQTVFVKGKPTVVSIPFLTGGDGYRGVSQLVLIDDRTVLQVLQIVLQALNVCHRSFPVPSFVQSTPIWPL